jgi:hypothetical protein
VCPCSPKEVYYYNIKGEYITKGNIYYNPRMPCENKGDISSENGQKGAIEVIFNLSHSFYIKRSMRRAEGKYTRRRIVYSGYKEKKAGRPPIGHG